MFLSSKSQRSFGLSHQIPRCTFQRDEVEFTRFAHSLGQMFRGTCKIQSGLGQVIKVSCKQICILSLMMSGACLKSGSMSRYCPVRSTPALNTRFNTCSHVCLYLDFQKTVDVFVSIIVWKTHRVIAVHGHPHNNAPAVFASSEAS